MATIVGHAPGMDEIARIATDEIEGWLREYPGYRGLLVLTDEAGETHVVPINGTLHSNNGMVNRNAAVGGAGIVLLPTFYVGDQIRSGELKPILCKFRPVEIAVYAATGQRVATLANGSRAAGQHTVDWDGTDENGRRVAPGIYFYELTAPGTQIAKKMLLVR